MNGPAEPRDDLSAREPGDLPPREAPSGAVQPWEAASPPLGYGPPPPWPGYQPLPNQQQYAQQSQGYSQPYPGHIPGYSPYDTRGVHPGAVILPAQKSVGLAVALAFFFGPLGMLYATLTGALVMFLVSCVVGLLTFGIGLILMGPFCAVWAGVAASSDNARLRAAVTRGLYR